MIRSPLSFGPGVRQTQGCARQRYRATVGAATTQDGSRMTFKVQVGPPQIAIHHTSTVLVTEPNGEMTWPSDRGLYLLDTRLISAWAVQANGEAWDLLNGG